MPNWNTDTLLTILVAITGLSLLLQLAVLIGIFVAVRKGMKVAEAKADEFSAKLKPIISTSTELIHSSTELIRKANTVIADLEPKISAAATDLSEMARTAREQTMRLQLSVEEINQRARNQAARVDGMATSVLNGLDRAGHMVNDAVRVPVRQVSGVIAAAKAVIETLRAPAPARQRVYEARVTEDKDLFV